MSENMDQEQMVKLVASDGNEFSVPKKWVHQSGAITEMLENSPDAPIRLEDVASPTLEKIIAYLEEHWDDPVDDEDSEDISSWDVEFLEIDQNDLYHLIMAADHLRIANLVRIGCKCIANMIRGKSVEEIRRIYNIPNDFTPEEEEQMRRENPFFE